MLLESLAYSRSAVENGAWWQLLTSSLAHLSASHLAGNLAAGGLLLALCRNRVNPREVLIVLVLAAAAVGLGLHFLTRLSWYGGLSGALWGLAGFAAMRCADEQPRRGRCLVLALCLIVTLDQGRTLAWNGEPLAPQAHLYGLAAGLLAALSGPLGAARAPANVPAVALARLTPATALRSGSRDGRSGPAGC